MISLKIVSCTYAPKSMMIRETESNKKNEPELVTVQ